MPSTSTTAPSAPCSTRPPRLASRRGSSALPARKREAEAEPWLLRPHLRQLRLYAGAVRSPLNDCLGGRSSGNKINRCLWPRILANRFNGFSKDSEVVLEDAPPAVHVWRFAGRGRHAEVRLWSAGGARRAPDPRAARSASDQLLSPALGIKGLARAEVRASHSCDSPQSTAEFAIITVRSAGGAGQRMRV